MVRRLAASSGIRDGHVRLKLIVPDPRVDPKFVPVIVTAVPTSLLNTSKLLNVVANDSPPLLIAILIRVVRRKFLTEPKASCSDLILKLIIK